MICCQNCSELPCSELPPPPPLTRQITISNEGHMELYLTALQTLDSDASSEEERNKADYIVSLIGQVYTCPGNSREKKVQKAALRKLNEQISIPMDIDE